MSPNNTSTAKKEDEYIDLYADLFEQNEAGKVHPSALTNQTTSAITTKSSSSSSNSLHDEVLFFNQLGSLEAEVKELRTVRQTLTTENEHLKATLATKERTIQVLRNNISSLYKTAKLELERRSLEIAEVRREYDTLVFRRRTTGSLELGGVSALKTAAPVDSKCDNRSADLVKNNLVAPSKENNSENKLQTARTRDHHQNSHSSSDKFRKTPLGPSSSSEDTSSRSRHRYEPYTYSTPRSQKSTTEGTSSAFRKAERPATEPVHRQASSKLYSSRNGSSSRHSERTPNLMHRSRLFD